MRAMEYLDQHQVLLHTRQQAARRDGIIFLALLIIILLFPWLLVTRTG